MSRWTLDGPRYKSSESLLGPGPLSFLSYTRLGLLNAPWDGLYPSRLLLHRLPTWNRHLFVLLSLNLMVASLTLCWPGLQWLIDWRENHRVIRSLLFLLLLGNDNLHTLASPTSSQPHCVVLIDDITSQIDYLREGMTIGGTWFQLVRQLMRRRCNLAHCQ